MKPEIKICGVKTPEAIKAAIDNGAHFIGFIFFEKSPRHLEIATAKKLRPLVKRPVQLVAVTVDADDNTIATIVQKVKPDILQLHGHETPERVKKLRATYGLPVIKAFSIQKPCDVEQISPYRNVADMILFDAKAPKDSLLPGGNGVAFDWSLLKSLDEDCQTVLSGGLNAQNVGEAIKIVSPDILDVSSGVESAPGIKDVKLIKGFFDAVKKTSEL